MKKNFFEEFADWVAVTAASTSAFCTALLIIIIWLSCGPLFDYSDTWQLVINTGTTIITFLWGFLILRNQRKEMLALNIKIDEIIRANRKANNTIIAIESLTEHELKVLHDQYLKLSKEKH